jgi:glycosyltransferase involved in cell wall biosynthesis
VTSPTLSIVVLAWNKLDLTRLCVSSLRAATRSEFELIVVDNGSTDGTTEFAQSHADKAVLNPDNLGFAAGMNSGLDVVDGEFVVFANNDTVFPGAWDLPLLADFDDHGEAGIVFPAVTAAGNPVSVRTEPGSSVEVMLPFGEFPSGVVYAVRSEQMRSLGGWNEEYKGASAEDLDLVFTMWAHDLDVILDTRVLVEHASQASMRNVKGLGALYRKNFDQFLDRWEAGPPGPLLDHVSAERYQDNLDRARTAVRWIRRMIEARDEASELRKHMEQPDRRRLFRSKG